MVDVKHMEKELSKNKQAFLKLLGESADIKKKTMQLGLKRDIGCLKIQSLESF